MPQRRPVHSGYMQKDSTLPNGSDILCRRGSRAFPRQAGRHNFPFCAPPPTFACRFASAGKSARLIFSANGICLRKNIRIPVADEAFCRLQIAKTGRLENPKGQPLAGNDSPRLYMPFRKNAAAISWPPQCFQIYLLRFRKLGVSGVKPRRVRLSSFAPS